MTTPFALGIDVGTQGVRVALVDARGSVLHTAREGWSLREHVGEASEQDAETWWSGVVACVGAIVASLDPAHRSSIEAVSVAATSGTLVVTDGALRPLRPALMWDDRRARTEAIELDHAIASADTGYVVRPQPGFSISKALWLVRHEPEVWQQVRYILSAGDWMLARLAGIAPVTDYTNALKLGFDLERLTWPQAALESVGISPELLPRVERSGTVLGQMSGEVAAEWGLTTRPTVILGMTDANAALVAGGASQPGTWTTTIGTGLSIKGISPHVLSDDTGALYSHRHWKDGWIPSATSHSGAGSIARTFGGSDPDLLTRESAHLVTSSLLVLPLVSVGEYFPFFAPEATGFEIGRPADRADRFRGYLEGIGFVERLAMERLEALGAPAQGPQITIGGGASNEAWLRIRASILGRPVSRPANASSAYGIALFASEAIEPDFDRVPVAELVVDPGSDAAAYEDRYGQWLQALEQRQYFSRVGTAK